ncbi:hypothetical protein FACS1894163_06430 [Spirochaetia bacterium]|nr:hypothetical protein FACS1894163_06430 [Spirochaetia bacterium]
MKWIYVFLILFVSVFSIFSQNGETTNMIPMGMVDPSENENAMNAYILGTKYLNENNLDEAVVQLSLALEYDPEFVDAMDHLGLTYRRLGKYKEAEIIYLKSMKLMPTNLAVYTNLGNLYRLEGRLEDARQIYIKLMELDK